jgi:hypothetical protein
MILAVVEDTVGLLRCGEREAGVRADLWEVEGWGRGVNAEEYLFK